MTLFDDAKTSQKSLLKSDLFDFLGPQLKKCYLTGGEGRATGGDRRSCAERIASDEAVVSRMREGQ